MNNLGNNKLFSILSTFSKVEFNRLIKFVNSPYFNANDDLIKLSEIYKNKIFKGHSPDDDKIAIWNSLYPNTKFNDVRFRKLSSDLLKLVEEYLAVEIFNKKKIQKINYTLESIGDRKLYKLYNSTLSNARRVSERTIFKDGEFYYDQYLIEKNYYNLKNSDLDRSAVTNVEDIINNLDYFYLIQKLRLLCETVSRKTIKSTEYQLLFLDEIISHLNKHSYDHVPAISIYFNMYLTMVSNEDKYYFKLKSLLEKHLHLFPKAEVIEIYTTPINYCLKQANLGSQEFLLEFLKLNENLLERNIIAENELSPWRFKNIITAACKLKRFDWADNFINQYIDKIPPNYRENAFTFNTAMLYFYQKKYSDLLPLLLQVDYQDFTYSLTSKIFTVVSYFELDEIEPLLSFIDAFRAYLTRQPKLSQKRKQKYLNTLKVIKKICKTSVWEENKIKKLKTEVESYKGELSLEDWVFEKITELENNTRPSRAH